MRTAQSERHCQMSVMTSTSVGPNFGDISPDAMEWGERGLRDFLFATSGESEDPYPSFGSGVILVTPELAELLLTRNTHNRKEKVTYISKYASDLQNGDWLFTGQPIALDWNGVLIDGQNRLHAIIKADESSPMVINWGLDPAVQDVVDIGCPRSLSDILSLHGEKNSARLGTILRRCYAWDHGGTRSLRTGTARVSTTQLVRFLDENPDIRDVTTIAGRYYSGIDAPYSVIGCLYRAFFQIDPTDAVFFFDRLKDGQDLKEGDAIYALRKALVGQKKKSRLHKPDDTLLFALIIKGWNAYRKGSSVHQLTWKGGGAHPETFPLPE